jgi:4'-phosphopantetheinyl transferase
VEVDDDGRRNRLGLTVTTHCRVWWADTGDRAVAELIGVLSRAELGRAERMHRAQDRTRFVTACWLLRSALAAVLGTSPADVPIDRRCDRCAEPHGRPRVLGAPARLDASVTHSGTRVGVALSLGGPVGLDVEELLDDVGVIAWSVLAPAERAGLRRLPAAERPMAFLRTWTCKEAALKATGHGLRVPPGEVEMAGPHEDPALRRWPLDTPPESVTVRTLDPGRGYVGAVALLARGAVRVSEAEFPARLREAA